MQFYLKKNYKKEKHEDIMHLKHKVCSNRMNFRTYHHIKTDTDRLKHYNRQVIHFYSLSYKNQFYKFIVYSGLYMRNQFQVNIPCEIHVNTTYYYPPS